ncbi:P44/Msp2 family outer membrane protein [Candidatus Anaplasma sp. TIGMIC]|uniref:P44/Msp2 family outer membrane protein n=1 Tax=Candidatus Anaplasma sp. TIGMIC TaxID=3020713 RepID=UPI00232E6449|nr:P44/Msp2 family outer membrane protein [Candidatus Anaplasma sp. TIGMIC]MDB1135509.1 P44/Msp2 family outer membrane protein [Candidatus Anaplasma sp. TIGMIC]
MVKPLGVGVVALSMLCSMVATTSHASYNAAGADRFYVSLGYGPTISGIRNFKVGVNGTTEWIFPYHVKVRSPELHSENFHWSADSYPQFLFKKNSYGFKGSAGYLLPRLRMEVEISHEKTDIVPSGRQKKLRGGGIPFVFGKKYTVYALRNSSNLLKMIDEYAHADFTRVAAYLRATPESKVIRDVNTIVQSFQELADTDPALSIIADNQARQAIRARASYEIKHVASNLAATKSNILVRAISMGLEGGEVLELNAIKNTSLTTNLCYDFPQVKGIKFRLSPYTCAGIGGSMIGITDGHANAQLSYKFKFGLSANIRNNCTAYLGVMYQQVIGKEYDDIPLKRLVDDVSPYNRSSDTATATFGLNYVSLEIGSRVSF